MPKKTREIIGGLEKKGFDRKEGDHIYLHYYNKQGKKTRVFTKVSHSKEEYGKTLLALIARQLRLNKQQLYDLIECPISRNEYEQILKGKKIID